MGPSRFNRKTKSVAPFHPAKSLGTSQKTSHQHSTPHPTTWALNPGCLRFRDPYFMVYEVSSPHNWVGFHPLTNPLKNQGPFFSTSKPLSPPQQEVLWSSSPSPNPGKVWIRSPVTNSRWFTENLGKVDEQNLKAPSMIGKQKKWGDDFLRIIAEII